MKQVLIIGLGRSATSLLQYLHVRAQEEQWTITVCERNIELLAERQRDFAGLKPIDLDISDEQDLLAKLKNL